jgi:hypothetical protein
LAISGVFQVLLIFVKTEVDAVFTEVGPVKTEVASVKTEVDAVFTEVGPVKTEDRKRRLFGDNHRIIPANLCIFFVYMLPIFEKHHLYSYLFSEYLQKLPQLKQKLMQYLQKLPQ